MTSPVDMICCDFEFMTIDLDAQKAIVVTENMKRNKGKKKSGDGNKKKRTSMVAFLMTSGPADQIDVVTTKQFIPSCNIFTEEVIEEMKEELNKYRAKILKGNEILIVWDTSGDKHFVGDHTIVDLREVFRHLKLLKYQQCCPENNESGLKVVAKKFLKDFEEHKNCQTDDWTNPNLSDEMLKYASYDVVLLQKLILFAKEKFGCQTFQELFEIAEKNRIVLEKNLMLLQQTRLRAYDEISRMVMQRKDLDVPERNELRANEQRKVTENFDKLDKKKQYAATSEYIVTYTVDPVTWEHRLVTNYDHIESPKTVTIANEEIPGSDDLCAFVDYVVRVHNKNPRKKSQDIRKELEFCIGRYVVDSSDHTQIMWRINWIHKYLKKGKCFCLLCNVLHENIGVFSSDSDYSDEEDNGDEKHNQWDVGSSCGSSCSMCGGHRCHWTDEEDIRWFKAVDDFGLWPIPPSNWRAFLRETQPYGNAKKQCC